MEPELAEAINDNVELMFRYYDNLMQLRKAVTEARAVINRYPEYKVNHRSSIDIQKYSKRVDINLYNVESFKDLLPLLDDLISLGYDPSKTGDADNGDYRYYDAGLIKVYAFLKTDSSKCIKVLVEEHSEVVIDKRYKIVCLDNGEE